MSLEHRWDSRARLAQERDLFRVLGLMPRALESLTGKTKVGWALCPDDPGSTVEVGSQRGESRERDQSGERTGVDKAGQRDWREGQGLEGI